jgi:hypothetical protein
MRRLLIITSIALVAAPNAFAAPGDGARAVQDCKSLRSSMGAATFRATYGTFGRCVRQWTAEENENSANAARACRTEREALGAAAFRAKYGGAPNAFGKCVSMARRSERAADRAATLNAARACKAERGTLGAEAFRAKYGGAPNAFGKCVSTLAQAKDEA